jgi:hypothetical protein
MVVPRRRAIKVIEYSDVGCRIVKGDPKRWDYFAWLAGDQSQPLKAHVYPNDWTLGNTYRNEMIRSGDLIALWITGQKKPGIYEFGWVISDEPYESDGFDPRYIVDPQDSGGLCQAIDFASVRLRDNYLPRPEMKANPVLSGAEQFHAAQGANPSYLDPDQARELARLLACRVPNSHLEAAKWDRLLD